MLCRLIAITLLLGPATASATVMQRLDIGKLTEVADRIVRGTVESAQSHWSADHQVIYTEMVVRVAQVYKGNVRVGAPLRVWREGGTVDGVGMRVYGAASFTVGEEALLFLETRGKATYTVGMAQGKLHISTDAAGRKRLAPDLSQIAFTDEDRPKTTPRTLAAVEREIRTHLRSAP